MSETHPSMPIEWRPILTATTEAEAAGVLMSIKNGEHFGMFIPVGSKLDREIVKSSESDLLPFIVRESVSLGLLDPQILNNGIVDSFPVGGGSGKIDYRSISSVSKAHFDLDEFQGPSLNDHVTNKCRVIGALMRPSPGIVMRPLYNKDLTQGFMHNSKIKSLITRELFNGEVIHSLIEPIVEIAVAGVGDHIVFFEDVPVADDIKALAVPHAFWSLTEDRHSEANVYTTSANPKFPTRAQIK